VTLTKGKERQHGQGRDLLGALTAVRRPRRTSAFEPRLGDTIVE
jgi:hypothetical protein